MELEELILREERYDPFKASPLTLLLQDNAPRTQTQRSILLDMVGKLAMYYSLITIPRNYTELQEYQKLPSGMAS